MVRRSAIINEDITPGLALCELFREFYDGYTVNASVYVKAHSVTRQTFYNRINSLSLKYPIYCESRGNYRMLQLKDSDELSEELANA